VFASPSGCKNIAKTSPATAPRWCVMRDMHVQTNAVLFALGDVVSARANDG
jgi:hypothetical protein